MAGMHTDRSGKQVVWEKRKTRNATFLITHAPGGKTGQKERKDHDQARNGAGDCNP